MNLRNVLLPAAAAAISCLKLPAVVTMSELSQIEKKEQAYRNSEAQNGGAKRESIAHGSGV